MAERTVEGNISKEGNNTTEASKEVLDFFQDANVPLHPKIEKAFNEEDSHSPRFGNGFTIGSGYILRRITNEETGMGFLDLMGTSTFEVEEKIWEEYEGATNSVFGRELSPSEIDQLVDMRMRAILTDPTEYSEELKTLEADRSFNWEGSKMISDWIKSRLSLLEETENEEINPFEKTNAGLWADCKDIEFLLSTSLLGSKKRTRYGASVLVYYDEEGPLFFQRTGGYHVSSSFPRQGKFCTESVAINLRPVTISGVTLQPGILFGILPKGGSKRLAEIEKSKKDAILHKKEIAGVYPVRPTIFSVTPEQQRQTFTSHFDSFQEASDFKGDETLTLDDFCETAEQVISKKNINKNNARG